VYAFRADVLAQIADRQAVSDASLEHTEALEQLGWLAGGWQIAVTVIEHGFVGIDTPEDYAAFVKRCASPAGRRGLSGVNTAGT
jgi:3-deoxy-manno-octulosonate cytidylyltransferase (CMP-KDO synthetase)